MKKYLNRALFLICTLVLVLFTLLTVTSLIYYFTFYSNSSVGGFIFSYIIHAPSSMQLFEIIYILAYITIVISFRNNQHRLTNGLSGLLCFGLLTFVLNLQSFKLGIIDLTRSFGIVIIDVINLMGSLMSILLRLIPLFIGLFIISGIIYLIVKVIKSYQDNKKDQNENQIWNKFKRPQHKTVIEVILATLLVSSLFIVIVLITLRLTNIVNV